MKVKGLALRIGIVIAAANAPLAAGGFFGGAGMGGRLSANAGAVLDGRLSANADAVLDGRLSANADAVLGGRLSANAGEVSGEGLSSNADAALDGSTAFGTLAGMDLHGYPEELAALLERNEEALDYVTGYPDREEYQSQPIDLTQDIHTGEIPLLMQWDRRWGYDAYGDGMIGLSGCGPVCLTMAYLYFTGDTSMTPREMAGFAYENGYCTEAGTSWELWTEGAARLGMNGEAWSLDETEMRRALDAGWLIVCSMGPGDFTTTGHFILIRGYDENGFYVNDPNRRSNSEKQWDFDTLRPQVKRLWVLR